MSAVTQRRFLHFVFKIGNRNETIKFYRSILGMKVLRHEEFEEGCKATCNGPFDGKWSKTMIGYGPEDNHFVVELTYNYGIKSYKLGNDFLGLVINFPHAIHNATNQNYEIKKDDDLSVIKSPDGYKFLIEDKLPIENSDPVKKVILASSNLKNSVDYWHGILGMEIYEQSDKKAVLGYGENQCKLELQDVGSAVDHQEAYGRIAFSCPTGELPTLQSKIKQSGHRVLTPLVSLDTPGKATVHVVILGDPDGHEICFVGDEAFRELSQVDPKADELLDAAMKADNSDEYFAKKKKSQK